MKRIIALLLVLVVILSISVVSALAYSPSQIAYFKDRFVEEYGEPQFYEELMWHYSDEGNTVLDWVFITAATEIMVEPIENPETYHYFVGDIVYSTIYIHAPFLVPYCVYDVSKDEFIPVSKVDFDEYDGLREFFCNGKYGKLIGDIDSDDEVSVLDATEIQRIVAKLSELNNFYVADFNRDRNVNVMDATAIQMKLAKIEENPTYNEDLVYSSLNNMDPNDGVWEQIEFEVLHNGKHEIEDCKKSDSTFVAIIKTKEQYDEIFAVYNDIYDEKFFEDNWLVASVCQVTDERMVAEISELYVSYGDFMIRLDKHIVGGDGIAQPTAPPYYSFAAVSKDSVNDVKNIIWI